MIVTTTADRIVNYSVIVILFACLSLWAIDYFFLGSRQSSRLQSVRIDTAKSVKTTTKGSMLTADAEGVNAARDNKSAQTNERGMSKAISAEFMSWYYEAVSTDSDFRKRQIHYRAKIQDQYYKDLYKILQLDDTTSEALREILADRSIATGIAVAANNSAFKEMERVKFEYNGKIATLLGSEKYEQFCVYEATLPQRSQIMLFRDVLEFSGEPLTVEQETALLPLIEHYVKNDPFLSAIIEIQMRTNPMAAVGLLRFTDRELNILKEVLSSSQTDTLRGFQKRRENLRTINYAWSDMGYQIRK